MADLDTGRLHAALLSMRDEAYRDFSCKLIPTVDADTVIGIRTPVLRKFAKEFARTDAAAEFLAALPHTYYEENLLHGMLISMERDFEAVCSALDAFLPYVDNWAVCDQTIPKAFAARPSPLLPKIRRWLADTHPYTVRFGVGMLMKFYLGDGFSPEILDMVAALRSEEYYVNMMIAWFFAEALAKRYDAALPYLLEHRLAPWTHNKAIQKATESYRISDARKAFLRTCKVTHTC